MSFRKSNLVDRQLSYHHSLTRSSSFGGTLGSRPRTGGRPSWAGQGVLGQGNTLSNREYHRMYSLPPYIKVPKTPRPERASQVSSAVAKGLRDCISTTRKDLLTIKNYQDDYRVAKCEGKVYELEKQLKAAERYLKRLEYLLTRIEDLNDQYSLNQRLRDGVRSMAHAYSTSTGKYKTTALNNVRSGYKECTDTLCNLEFQMEQLIGTLTFDMKGIQGFARLCPGDVFEVTIKHGPQKWKSRGRIAKDCSQVWDNSSFVFKILIGELLIIKAMEIKLLGKSVLIGRKVCETKELFSSHAQLMSVNLNAAGSLKLSLIITWLPLEGGSDETLTRAPSTSAASPRLQRRPFYHSSNSSPPIFSHSHSYYKDCSSLDGDRDSSFGSMSYRSGDSDSASPRYEHRSLDRDNSSQSEAISLSRTDSRDSLATDGRDSDSLRCYELENFTLVRREETSIKSRFSMYDSLRPSSEINKLSLSFPNLALNTASSASSIVSSKAENRSYLSLKDITNNNDEQMSLITIQNDLPEVWKDHKKSSSDEPESIQCASLTWNAVPPQTLKKVICKLKNQLEDIQGQFPQLQSLEEAVLQLHSLCKVPNQVSTRRDSNTSEISLSVESALECFDFLNAECEDDFGDDLPEVQLAKTKKEATLKRMEESEGENKLVTGSEQIDAFLLIHLKHASLLFQDLGSFGPLRRKEQESLRQLQVEGKLMSTVMSHKENFDSLKPQHIIPVPHVQVLWDSVAGEEDWCVSAKSVVNGLIPVVSSLINPNEAHIGRLVLEELVRKMTHNESYNDDIVVTVGHFLNDLVRPLQNSVPETAVDIQAAKLLLHDDLSCIEEGISLLSTANITHAKLLSLHFLKKGKTADAVLNILAKNNQNSCLLLSLLDNCLLLIESSNSQDRASGCSFLGKLLPLIPKEQVKQTNEQTTPDNKANGEQNGNKEDQTNKNNKCDSSIPSELIQPISILSYLQQNDPSDQVRNAARQSLKLFGEIGQKALRQVQLSSNGFQGVDVKF